MRRNSSRNHYGLNSIGVFCIVALGLIGAGQLFAQWLPEVNLTDDTEFDRYTSHHNAWSVAVDTAGRVSVVWEDDRSGWHVYFKQRIDTVWSDDTLLVATGSLNPSVTADLFGNTHVVWQDGRDPGWGEIYYKEKTSSGWSADVRLTVDTSMSEYPCVAVDGCDNIHVLWQDWRDTNWEIYYKTRDSLGNWQLDERLTVDIAFSGVASVATDESQNVHVTWSDTRDGDGEIYYKVNTDGVWSPDTALTFDDDLISSYSSIACDMNGDVHLVWHDQRNGFWEIYYKEKTGSTWSPDTSIVPIGNPGWPNTASDRFGNIHVVWMDERDGYSRVYYRAKDTSGVWSADFPVSAESYPWNGSPNNPSVAADKFGNVHVVWYVDYWDSSGYLDGADIYYREKRAPIGVEETDAPSALSHRAFRLLQNHPNPFSHLTSISYSLPQTTGITLSIYDITGRLVETLVNETQQPGMHQVRWDRASNISGVYFYRLMAGELVETRKMVVLD